MLVGAAGCAPSRTLVGAAGCAPSCTLVGGRGGCPACTLVGGRGGCPSCTLVGAGWCAASACPAWLPPACDGGYPPSRTLGIPGADAPRLLPAWLVITKPLMLGSSLAIRLTWRVPPALGLASPRRPPRLEAVSEVGSSKDTFAPVSDCRRASAMDCSVGRDSVLARVGPAGGSAREPDR